VRRDELAPTYFTEAVKGPFDVELVAAGVIDNGAQQQDEIARLLVISSQADLLSAGQVAWRFWSASSEPAVIVPELPPLSPCAGHRAALSSSS
jgi:hypothetical protein